jgi:predicted HTH transcriptional regulator
VKDTYTFHKGQNTEKDKNEGKAHNEEQKPKTTYTSSFQMKKQSRRDQILALFVKGVDVSIKDIASRIKGCSEKTIQRELNGLLYEGLIERIGEKRWSRYILK